MKKIFALLMAVMMVFSFAACGNDDGNKGEGGKAPRDGSNLDIDLKAEGLQTIGEPEATVEILKKTAEEYLEGSTMFFNDARQYADFVDYIGCDATEYEFKEVYGKKQGSFIWRATDDDTAYFAVFFDLQEDGTWKLSASGSGNLGIVF